MAQYGPEVQEALSVVWSAANGICAKRLVPFLPELIPTLERHGHLVVTDEVREQWIPQPPSLVRSENLTSAAAPGSGPVRARPLQTMS
jgi:hypothetical protein